MPQDKLKIPFAISEYIRNQFRSDFLFEVKEVKRVKGVLVYNIEVAKDNYIHTLQFNENGKLLSEESEPAFPSEGDETPIV